MPRQEERLYELTERVIGCAFRVSNTLGCGFLEKVYENALLLEIGKNGLQVSQQAPINVYYDRELVGEYFADLLVADLVIIELKAAQEVNDAATAQCLNYLKATGMPVCLLLNFGKPKVEIKRFRM